MTATTWTNFAGDQTCTPAVFAQPTTRDGVRHAIRGAASVRVAGGGHSFTDAVLTDGTLLSLRRLSRVLDIDTASGLVRCEAGITLGALSAVMWDAGLAFANLGDIDVQSVAGACATATHGTGAALGNLSTGLRSVELVLASGDVVELDGGDALRAARVSIGALGVVTAVTLQAVPAFTLSGVDTTEPVEDVLASLEQRTTAHDHFGFFTFGHSPLAMTKTWDRVDAPPAPPSRAVEWLEDVVLTNYAYWGACRVARARPAWIPAINRLCSRLSGTTRRVDRSYRIFATPRRVPITEMEYAIPRAAAAEAVRAVRAVAARHPVPVPIEVRFVAPDDAFLSPAGGRDTCYIAVHQFAGLQWDAYFREVEALLVALGGRPHWGKRHFRRSADLAPAYPEWDRFQAVRDELDPSRVFTNAYVARVLGA